MLYVDEGDVLTSGGADDLLHDPGMVYQRTAAD